MRNSFSFILCICLLLSALLPSCADVPTFVPANPCDPDYTGNEVCPSDVVDTGVHLDTGQTVQEDVGTDAGSDVGYLDVGQDAGDIGTDDCECNTVSACCDGCHPIAVGEVCDDDGLACTEQRCSSVGICELIVVDDWCLVEGACSYTQNDPYHCGACGNMCRRDQVCHQGECVASCPSGFVDCTGGCMDLDADPLHCGECGHQCGPSEGCIDGSCLVPCLEGLSDCDGTCVDRESDPFNCGECGVICDRNKVCSAGICVASCGEGRTDCAGACVILNSNRLHCGQCGNACRDNQVCVDGDCVIPCDEELTDCGGTCVSLMDDEDHCGQCNHTCSQGASCVEGECITAVTGVTLSPTTLNLGVGEISNLTATVQPANATDKSVVWNSSSPAVASVDEDGTVTAVGEGSAIITVTTVDGGFTAFCQATVVIRVTGVTVEPAELSLMPGEQANLQAVVAPVDATNKAISWTSSDLNVATVDNTGNVEAVSPGNATITVTTADGNKQAHCEVTVGSTAVTGITITPPAITIVKRQSIQLQADIIPEDATDKRMLWTSSDGDVVAVDSGGVITGLAGGQATVTATTLSGGKTDTCVVTVRVPVTGIAVTPESLVIPPGGAGQLTASIVPEDATNKAVTWQSADEAIATVDNNGIVSGHQAGYTSITVKTADGNHTATANIRVGIPVTGVTVEPEELFLMPGEQESLTATVLPADATDKRVEWSSSDAAIATVNDVGLVTALNVGMANITAATAESGYAYSIPVQVGVSVTGVTLTPSSLRIPVGETGLLYAQILPDNATDKRITWLSSDPQVLSVDSNGRVSGLTSGSAEVSVSTVESNFSAVSTIEVYVPVSEISIDPAYIELERETSTTLTATILPANATNKAIVWHSDNSAAVTVDSEGNVSALHPGTATISATAEEGGHVAVATVHVPYRLREQGPAGGWVFYDKGNYSDGWRYIEAAPTDIASGAYWGCNGVVLGTSTGYGSGRSNTASIIENCNERNTAAKKCDEYVFEHFDDWYLPSINELSAMYNSLHKHNIGDFNSWYYACFYWSSSEQDYPYPQYNVQTAFFGSGQFVVTSKTINGCATGTSSNIRPVRYF